MKARETHLPGHSRHKDVRVYTDIGGKYPLFVCGWNYRETLLVTTPNQDASMTGKSMPSMKLKSFLRFPKCISRNKLTRSSSEESELNPKAQGNGSAYRENSIPDSVNAAVRTLSLSSENRMNRMGGSHTVPADTPTPMKSMNGTIRSVPAEDLLITSSSTSDHSDDAHRQGRVDINSMPHSTTLSYIPHSQPPLTHQNMNLGAGQRGLVRTISTEFGAVRSLSSNNLSDNSASSNGNGAASNANGDNGWSSAVGRANLGKSGRVIEKLMADNDTLRRELNVERLKAAESKEAVKNLQEQMQQAAEQNNGTLHDAAVNKTLLRRKERQVDDLTAEIEAVKKRCREAEEREQQWKDEAERVRLESLEKVEEAKMFNAMMEGRVNTMANHWKDQEKVANKSVSIVRKEVDSIVQQRREDDRKIVMLQTVCDQQAVQLGGLIEQNQELQAHFEAYKDEQEKGLAGIKEKASKQIEENEEILEKSRATLGELRWALNVKENVKGAC